MKSTSSEPFLKDMGFLNIGIGKQGTNGNTPNRFTIVISKNATFDCKVRRGNNILVFLKMLILKWKKHEVFQVPRDQVKIPSWIQDEKIVLVNLETSCFDEYGALLIAEDISYIDYLFLIDCEDIRHMSIHRFH